MMDDEKIIVALAADQNYLKGMLVTACSVAKHASECVTIVWVILDGGIRPNDLSALQRFIVRDHERSLFRVIKFDKSILNGVTLYNGSVMTYARLFLPKLLPDCNFVVYCDVDFLWRADISELWGLRDKKYAIQSVVDEHIHRLGSPEEERWCSMYNFKFDRKSYFCAGLCIFNLDKLRSGVVDHLIKVMHECPNAPMADQSIMNAILPKEDVGLLPARWQRLVVELTEDKVVGPVVIHYAGIPPWKSENSKLMTDAMLAWYREYARVMGGGLCMLWEICMA